MYEHPGKCGKSFDYDIIFQARFKRKQAIPKYQPALLIYKLANGHKRYALFRAYLASQVCSHSACKVGWILVTGSTGSTL
jgi:hypothetical protein